MLRIWERRLYAAALVAAPLIDLIENRISIRVMDQDFPNTDAGQVQRLQAIHAHDGLWQLDSAIALLYGFTLVAAAIGLVKLTRVHSPRLTTLTTLLLVPGAIGMCMHAVFWNMIYGSMSRVADVATMPDLINRTNYYPPFIAALVLVIIVLNLGFLTSALALWRSRTVPWWAALLSVAYPLEDLFGASDWTALAAGVLWVLSWSVAARAMLRFGDVIDVPAPEDPIEVGQPASAR